MRVLATFVAVVLVIMMMSQLVSAAAVKNICVPIAINGTTINPAGIPAGSLTNLTNRGQGLFSIAISLCSPASAPAPCSGSGFVAVTNQTSGSSCAVGFDTVLMRPTALSGSNGFEVQYGSSASGHTKDTFHIQVLCDPSSGAALSSKSRKFATMSPNKLGGTSYELIAYSSVACATAPTPAPTAPTGPTSRCRKFMSGGVSVDPSTWAPQYVLLMDLNGNEYNFFFSPCAANATPDPYMPPCASTGYITEFDSQACLAWSWDTMTGFMAGNGFLNITYASSTNPRKKAVLSVTCLEGMTNLTSSQGIFLNNSNTFTFPLGINALCGGDTTMAPWTAPPEPSSMSGSGSHGGTTGAVPPSGGSQSGMPSGGSMPSGDSQSGAPAAL